MLESIAALAIISALGFYLWRKTHTRRPVPDDSVELDTLRDRIRAGATAEMRASLLPLVEELSDRYGEVAPALVLYEDLAARVAALHARRRHLAKELDAAGSLVHIGRLRNRLEAADEGSLNPEAEAARRQATLILDTLEQRYGQHLPFSVAFDFFDELAAGLRHERWHVPS